MISSPQSEPGAGEVLETPFWPRAGGKCGLGFSWHSMCMCVCMHVSTCLCVSISMCMYMCRCVCVSTCACICEHEQGGSVHVRTAQWEPAKVACGTLWLGLSGGVPPHPELGLFCWVEVLEQALHSWVSPNLGPRTLCRLLTSCSYGVGTARTSSAFRGPNSCSSEPVHPVSQPRRALRVCSPGLAASLGGLPVPSRAEARGCEQMGLWDWVPLLPAGGCSCVWEELVGL